MKRGAEGTSAWNAVFHCLLNWHKLSGDPLLGFKNWFESRSLGLFEQSILLWSLHILLHFVSNAAEHWIRIKWVRLWLLNVEKLFEASRLLTIYLTTDEHYRKLKVAANHGVSSHSLLEAFGFVCVCVITIDKGVTGSGLLFEMWQLLFFFLFSPHQFNWGYSRVLFQDSPCVYGFKLLWDLYIAPDTISLLWVPGDSEVAVHTLLSEGSFQ